MVVCMCMCIFHSVSLFLYIYILLDLRWFLIFSLPPLSLSLYIYCYATMCPAGLQGAVRPYQVHQLKQDTHVGCGLATLFNIIDITNSLAGPHFKATRWVLGELLKFNTASFTPQIQGLRQIKYFHNNNKKDFELPCLD